LLVRALAPLIVLIAAGAPRLAAGDTTIFGTAEVAVSGGHDTNMFLQVSPDAAMRQPRISGFFGHGAPRLGAGLSAGGWRLDLSYSGDYRGSEAAGHLILQQGELTIAFPRMGPFRATLVGSGGRFDSTRFSADRFLFAGGGLDLRLEVTKSFRVTTDYRLELREYPGRAGESDLLHLAELRLAYRPGTVVEFGLGSAFLSVAPADSMALLDDSTVKAIRAGPDIDLVWRRLTLGLSAWGGTIALNGFEQDWQIGGELGALLRVRRNVDISFSAEITAAPWASDLRAQDYTRRYFGVGMIVHATGRHAFAAPPPPPAPLRPVVEKGKARFRLRDGHASEVTVVGSWDDWAAPGMTLTHTREPGLWEAWVEVPPGTHKYRFLVDGRAVRPPDAARYAQDDFGGEDAVIEVPGEGGER